MPNAGAETCCPFSYNLKYLLAIKTSGTMKMRLLFWHFKVKTIWGKEKTNDNLRALFKMGDKIIKLCCWLCASKSELELLQILMLQVARISYLTLLFYRHWYRENNLCPIARVVAVLIAHFSFSKRNAFLDIETCVLI